MVACFSTVTLEKQTHLENSELDIVDPAIDRYLDNLADDADPVRHEMEALARERSFPIVGPQVGRMLYVLARSISARRVIELGSGFGYSAYWFARAVGAGGEVVLTEGSPEKAQEAADFLDRAGLGDRVKILTGDGLELIGRESGPFDIVFNDVDKEQYPRVPPLAHAALRIGGLLISDNMLWQGNVLERDPAEDSTRGVHELTRTLYDSDLFETTLIPMRDGVTVSLKVR